VATALFRQEVLEAQKAQWLGSIRIARPPSFAWVTGISVVLAVALVAFALWGQVTRKARLPGMLVPTGGLIQVVAPQAGTLAEWMVAEGDTVTAGQTLARISLERHIANGEAHALSQIAMGQRRSSLEAELRVIDQQTRQRHDALADRIRSLAAEERQAQADLQSAGQRVQLARQNLQRYQELASSGFVSTVQAQQRQEELLDVQTRENTAQRQVQALQREQQSLVAEQANNASAGQSNRQQVQRAIASLGQEVIEADARQAVLLKASKAGRVSAMAVQRGHTVQPGQPVLSLVTQEQPEVTTRPLQDQETGPKRQPPGALEAHLFAPTRTAGFVRPGQSVWLRYAAYPYQKFGMARGEVIRVSESPLSSQELPAGQAQSVLSIVGTQEPLRRVTVRLDQQFIEAYGERFVLTAGASLEADVVQEKRVIWEWMFEPLLAARQQLNILSTIPNKKTSTSE
jgi:membrane fusion protein